MTPITETLTPGITVRRSVDYLQLTFLDYVLARGFPVYACADRSLHAFCCFVTCRFHRPTPAPAPPIRSTV